MFERCIPGSEFLKISNEIFNDFSISQNPLNEIDPDFLINFVVWSYSFTYNDQYIPLNNASRSVKNKKLIKI